MVAQVAPGPDFTARRRVVADRFRRIWYIVEDIAATPGQSRAALAEKYHLSERQVQADLNIIRSDMRLPLRRDGGYRFGLPGERPGATNLALVDALTVLALVTEARASRSKLTVHLDALASRLPSMFPIHLQPLIRYVLRSPLVATLVGAMLNSEQVCLQWPRDRAPSPFTGATNSAATIKPVLILPYLDGWYVIGEWVERGRHVMLNLGGVLTASVVS